MTKLCCGIHPHVPSAVNLLDTDGANRDADFNVFSAEENLYTVCLGVNSAA